MRAQQCLIHWLELQHVAQQCMSESLVICITELLGPAASASMHQLRFGTVEVMDCVNACSVRRE